jgi:hypothetical protein
MVPTYHQKPPIFANFKPFYPFLEKGEKQQGQGTEPGYHGDDEHKIDGKSWNMDHDAGECHHSEDL